MPIRLAVTGANGFVGREVLKAAVSRGHLVRAVVRSPAAADSVARAGVEPVEVRGLDAHALEAAFVDCAAVVHLAQIGAERGGQSFEAVNVAGTRAVLAAMEAAGVRRIVYLSGLGVSHYGMARRTTNGYFLSKCLAEASILDSSVDASIFRPSYVVGPGDAFVPALLRQLAAAEVPRPGDGSYRMQPVAVSDVAEAVVVAAEGAVGSAVPGPHRVYDLVGPEALTLDAFVLRLAKTALAAGLPAEARFREVPLEEAERLAAAGGFEGMLPEELDCMLCDEVSDPAPLQRLLGRPLMALDRALELTVAPHVWLRSHELRRSR
jgi:nucleoside-diphosphate-sugar epimerase